MLFVSGKLHVFSEQTNMQKFIQCIDFIFQKGHRVFTLWILLTLLVILMMEKGKLMNEWQVSYLFLEKIINLFFYAEMHLAILITITRNFNVSTKMYEIILTLIIGKVLNQFSKIKGLLKI